LEIQKNAYEHAMYLSEELFDGRLDQNGFEENLRYVFGSKAFPIYSITALIGGIVKFVSVINAKQSFHLTLLFHSVIMPI
jgi:paired amphipathic helix protein Sin3a